MVIHIHAVQVLDVTGEPMKNRDGMSMLQVLSKPRRSIGPETVRGGWVAVAPKNASVDDRKQRYVRKLGEGK